MTIRNVSAFEILYATMRYLYEERKAYRITIRDCDFEFEDLEFFLNDAKFAEKMASVLNYITAQVLMKMDCKQDEMATIIASIIEEQMFLLDTTLHEYPDGPLRKRTYHNEKEKGS